MSKIELLEFDYNADDAREAVEDHKRKSFKTALENILNHIAREANNGRETLTKSVPIKYSDFCLEQLRLRGFIVEISSLDRQDMFFIVSWKKRKD